MKRVVNAATQVLALFAVAEVLGWALEQSHPNSEWFFPGLMRCIALGTVGLGLVVDLRLRHLVRRRERAAREDFKTLEYAAAQYHGKWVAVLDGVLVGWADTLEDLLAATRRGYPGKSPLLHHFPPGQMDQDNERLKREQRSLLSQLDHVTREKEQWRGQAEALGAKLEAALLAVDRLNSLRQDEAVL